MADRSHMPTQPRQRPTTNKQLRKRMEAALDRLLNAVEAIVADLDALDGDPDLEPSLGAIEGHYARADQRATWTGQTAVRRYGGSLLDIDDSEHDGREEVCEDEGAQCEDEGYQTDDEGDAQAPCFSSATWPPSPQP